MEVIFILIGISLSLAVGFLLLFIRAMRKGQFDDAYTPSVRILFDKPKKPTEKNQPSTHKLK